MIEERDWPFGQVRPCRIQWSIGLVGRLGCYDNTQIHTQPIHNSVLSPTFMKATAPLFIAFASINALQNYDKKPVKEPLKPGKLMENRYIFEEENTKHKHKQTSRRKNSSLVKTESGANEFELPIQQAEEVDRSDHEELPDFADNPPIFSLALADFLPIPAKTVTSVLMKTVVKAAKTTKLAEEEPIKPAVEVTLIEAPVTATLVIAPEIVYTTLTPTIPINQIKSTKTGGWVIVTPGVNPGEKNNQQAALKDKGYLLRDDALPDAVNVVSNLWHDEPVFITETILVTTRMARTPPPPKSMPTATTKQLKKFEKRTAGKKVTTTTAIKINTNLIKMDPKFTIAPDDIYRGVHAKSPGVSITLSLGLGLFSTILAAFLL